MTIPSAERDIGRKRVVVAIDFSEPSIAAATWVARHFAPEAELVLLHVLHVPPLPHFLEGRYPTRAHLEETARAGAEVHLREVSASIARGLVWPEVRVGKPDEEVVRVAAEYDADFVVVSRPAPRTGVWRRIGTTSQRVLRRSPVPVLLAAGMSAGEPARVLIAVDDSDMTGAVLQWGSLLADRFSAEAVAMHVVSVPFFPGATALDGASAWWASEEARDGDAADDESAARDAEQWLRTKVDGADDARMAPLVITGSSRPNEAIVEEAARLGAELIIVGSSGAGGVPRLLLGSVAESVLRGAQCPVFVVVPPPQGEPATPRAKTGHGTAKMSGERYT
jgi:nucleotide-binding universal stress UspA family protein